ncbi:hypothetical protein NVP1081O_249 [Vibrio phage 1.081.O._10N.286.52.C2]|nr:hypothetical protein NVP1081O_249 [Vibrio phage 1.081.O._10N.286.52.C2]
MFDFLKKSVWVIVGASQPKMIWTLRIERPQVLARVLLLEDQFGKRDYRLELLDESNARFTSSARFCMIDQFLPKNYMHKYVGQMFEGEPWSIDKIHEVHGEIVFQTENITQ